jgi:uncharacterized RmlC-like cupin family protein
MTNGVEQAVIRLRPQEQLASRQGLPYFLGISRETAGATAISLNIVIIPPAPPPRRICTRGTRRRSMSSKDGWTRAMSTEERAVALVARSDPNEQESVMAYDPSQAEATSVSTSPWVLG